MLLITGIQFRHLPAMIDIDVRIIIGYVIAENSVMLIKGVEADGLHIVTRLNRME